MRLLAMLFLAVLAAARPSAVQAWGNDGHHIVGAIADARIRGTKAEANVKLLLQGSNLDTYAIWADCAKHYCRDWFDQEMQSFLAVNPHHHDYHYTDIPVQEPGYRPNSVGANQFDVVHKLTEYINVLRDGPITNQNWRDKRLALIMIVHLVGDIHQPLHVGAVYVGNNETFVNPNLTRDFAETQGGNFLMRTASGDLHSFWDTDAVRRAMRLKRAATPEALAAVLARGRNVATPGDPGTWPVTWANESLALAAQAYEPIRLGPRKMVTEKKHTHPEWPIIAIPADYPDYAGKVATAQLTKGGHRLGELLMAIWP